MLLLDHNLHWTTQLIKVYSKAIQFLITFYSQQQIELLGIMRFPT